MKPLTCAQCQELGLTAPDPAVAAHLEHCDHCRELLAFQIALEQSLAELPPYPAPPDLRAAVRTRLRSQPQPSYSLLDAIRNWAAGFNPARAALASGLAVCALVAVMVLRHPEQIATNITTDTGVPPAASSGRMAASSGKLAAPSGKLAAPKTPPQLRPAPGLPPAPAASRIPVFRKAPSLPADRGDKAVESSVTRPNAVRLAAKARIQRKDLGGAGPTLTPPSNLRPVAPSPQEGSEPVVAKSNGIASGVFDDARSRMRNIQPVVLRLPVRVVSLAPASLKEDRHAMRLEQPPLAFNGAVANGTEYAGRSGPAGPAGGTRAVESDSATALRPASPAPAIQPQEPPGTIAGYQSHTYAADSHAAANPPGAVRATQPQDATGATGAAGVAGQAGVTGSVAGTPGWSGAPDAAGVAGPSATGGRTSDEIKANFKNANPKRAAGAKPTPVMRAGAFADAAPRPPLSSLDKAGTIQVGLEITFSTTGTVTVVVIPDQGLMVENAPHGIIWQGTASANLTQQIHLDVRIAPQHGPLIRLEVRDDAGRVLARGTARIFSQDN